MTTRRQILMAVGAGAMAGPMAVLPQGKMWRVGFLHIRSRPTVLDEDYVGAFRRGMRELNYIEGKSIQYEWRFAGQDPERLAEMAADLVQLKVDAILAGGSQAVRAARRATSAIPIVMAGIADPIGAKFVTNLARPGANVTGLSNISGDVSQKRLELLLATVPTASRVALLLNYTNPTHTPILNGLEQASRKLGVQLLALEARTPESIERAFEEMARQKAQALIVVNDGLFVEHRIRIVALAASTRIPAIFTLREYVVAGGLISYGQDASDHYRRAAAYVDRIFKGAKPGDLPVEQTTKFELILNQKTAKALGVSFPREVMMLADRVIE